MSKTIKSLGGLVTVTHEIFYFCLICRKPTPYMSKVVGYQ